ncbi:hypothetical protein FA15DRAFT_673189 [Coprinopsis marcescibilis]|uniref:Uncharacterized protein n=1 Tax=Coprinopsis marcescibilis TaxID=230819 RepID=A0A5C3KLE6_COPMA|nr:hypothetical protein FA15DRAFT_673189 [Coprinopsis marcescibilis]
MNLKVVCNNVLFPVLLLLSLCFCGFVVDATPTLGTTLSSFRQVSWFAAVATPDLDDFWQFIQKELYKANVFTDKLLSDSRKRFTDVAADIDDFKDTMNRLVSLANEIGTEFHDSLETHHLTKEDLHNILSAELGKVVQTLNEEFQEPLPENRDERYQERERRLNRGIDAVEIAFVKMCAAFKMPEAEARAKFSEFQPELYHVLIITGNIIDRHPVIIETILFSAAVLLVPESWILRPILSAFGFGPTGPVKGSVAAWMQRVFWGGYVKRGSWFALLQRAGMKLPGLGKIGTGIGIGIGVGAGWLSCR